MLLLQIAGEDWYWEGKADRASKVSVSRIYMHFHGFMETDWISFFLPFSSLPSAVK